MIEDTIFTEKTIKSVVKQKYDIDVTSIKKLNRGSANIYSLNNDKYILKEFQAKYTKKEIDKEIEIINHLKSDGIPVPEYISTVNDKYCFKYKGKVIIMQKYINGYTIDSNTGSDEQVLESGYYLGKIIKSLESSNIKLTSNDITDWYSKDTLEESIQKHKDLLKLVDKAKEPKIYQDFMDKLEMLNYVKDKMDFTDMKHVSVMKTHGDYNVLQFMYKKDKICAIIDFVSACKMPVIWEIIRSYSYIDPKAQEGRIDIDTFVKYVREVNKSISLNKYDYKYMPYLYMIQILTSTFGYKQYLKDNSKTSLLEFGFFRTRLCKDLFKNADLISQVLIDEFIKE